MSLGPKVIASVLGAAGTVGGIAGGVIYATSAKAGVVSSSVPETKEVNVNSGSANEESIVQETQPQLIPPVKEAGNCTVIDTEDESVFDNLSLNREDYTIVSCQDVESEDSESDEFNGRWTGLLPNDLFGYYMGLDVGTSFNLETNTKIIQGSSDNVRKTTFKSNSFENSPVVGEWGSSVETTIGKSITIVTLTSDKHSDGDSIYLLFDQEIE